MDTAADCRLKAENYAIAAQASADPNDVRMYVRLAAIWRVRELRLKLGRHAHTLPPVLHRTESRW